MISVLIPVRNGGEELRRCLEGIRSQRVDEEVEVVVVDSASTDGSTELARSLGARVHEIPVEEFNHGGTRNLAAELARGGVLVFTTQDAYADSEEWLACLVGPLREEPALAGVYGRQLPHDDATPPERFFLDFLYGPEARTQRADAPEELTMETTLFSNVNAAIRREAWERFRFADDIVMSEDQDWARRVLLAGHALRYEPAAAVRHSHRYTIGSAFRRFFDSGASAERAYLPPSRAARRALRGSALRYAREETAWLLREGHARWLPYAAVYELAKYAGLHLGTHHKLLPRPLRRRFSSLPGYWDGDRPEVGPSSARTAQEKSPATAEPGTVGLISEPAPDRCVACGSELAAWRAAEPQEPTLTHAYLLLRCTACGTASTAGPREPELHETGVYDAASTRLSGIVEALRRGYESQRIRILRRAVPPPATVVDAGAGQGRFVAAAQAAGYAATGFEPSSRGVEIAAARGIELEHASLDEAAVAPGSVDAITLSHVLEHLDDPGAALDRIATWLRPGGALLLGVPNLASLQAAIGGSRWLHLDVPRHRHHFAPAGLRSLLAKHGFEVEREHHVLLEHNPFGMWQAWADRFTTTPSYAYNLVKRNVELRVRDLLATLAVAVLAPLAVALELAAGFARRGGTIVVVARRR